MLRRTSAAFKRLQPPVDTKGSYYPNVVDKAVGRVVRQTHIDHGAMDHLPRREIASGYGQHRVAIDHSTTSTRAHPYASVHLRDEYHRESSGGNKKGGGKGRKGGRKTRGSGKQPTGVVEDGKEAAKQGSGRQMSANEALEGKILPGAAAMLRRVGNAKKGDPTEGAAVAKHPSKALSHEQRIGISRSNNLRSQRQAQQREAAKLRDAKRLRDARRIKASDGLHPCLLQTPDRKCPNPATCPYTQFPARTCLKELKYGVCNDHARGKCPWDHHQAGQQSRANNEEFSGEVASSQGSAFVHDKVPPAAIAAFFSVVALVDSKLADLPADSLSSMMRVQLPLSTFVDFVAEHAASEWPLSQQAAHPTPAPASADSEFDAMMAEAAADTHPGDQHREVDPEALYGVEVAFEHRHPGSRVAPNEDSALPAKRFEADREDVQRAAMAFVEAFPDGLQLVDMSASGGELVLELSAAVVQGIVSGIDQPADRQHESHDVRMSDPIINVGWGKDLNSAASSEAVSVGTQLLRLQQESVVEHEIMSPAATLLMFLLRAEVEASWKLKRGAALVRALENALRVAENDATVAEAFFRVCRGGEEDNESAPGLSGQESALEQDWAAAVSALRGVVDATGAAGDASLPNHISSVLGLVRQLGQLLERLHRVALLEANGRIPLLEVTADGTVVPTHVLALNRESDSEDPSRSAFDADERVARQRAYEVLWDRKGHWSLLERPSAIDWAFRNQAINWLMLECGALAPELSAALANSPSSKTVSLSRRKTGTLATADVRSVAHAMTAAANELATLASSAAASTEALRIAEEDLRPKHNAGQGIADDDTRWDLRGEKLKEYNRNKAANAKARSKNQDALWVPPWQAVPVIERFVTPTTPGMCGDAVALFLRALSCAGREQKSLRLVLQITHTNMLLGRAAKLPAPFEIDAPYRIHHRRKSHATGKRVTGKIETTMTRKVFDPASMVMSADEFKSVRSTTMMVYHMNSAAMAECLRVLGKFIPGAATKLWDAAASGRVLMTEDLGLPVAVFTESPPAAMLPSSLLEARGSNESAMPKVGVTAEVLDVGFRHVCRNETELGLVAAQLATPQRHGTMRHLTWTDKVAHQADNMPLSFRSSLLAPVVAMPVGVSAVAALMRVADDDGVHALVKGLRPDSGAVADVEKLLPLRVQWKLSDPPAANQLEILAAVHRELVRSLTLAATQNAGLLASLAVEVFTSRPSLLLQANDQISGLLSKVPLERRLLLVIGACTAEDATPSRGVNEGNEREEVRFGAEHESRAAVWSPLQLMRALFPPRNPGSSQPPPPALLAALGDAALQNPSGNPLYVRAITKMLLAKIRGDDDVGFTSTEQDADSPTTWLCWYLTITAGLDGSILAAAIGDPLHIKSDTPTPNVQREVIECARLVKGILRERADEGEARNTALTAIERILKMR